MNELLKRTLTSIGFGAVMLAGLTIHEFGFLALMLIIHTGCLWEYQLLIAPQQEYRFEQKKKAFVYSMVSGTIIFYLLSTGFRFLFFINDYIYFLIVPLLLGYLILELFLKSNSQLRNAALNAMGVIYISFPLSMAIFFSYHHENAAWFPERSGVILGIVLLVWLHDTMAYFAGSIFGRNRIMPSVSPKKSWEGFFTGLASTLLAGWILSGYFHQFSPIGWMVVGAIVSVFGTLGDLVESMMKRAAGIKDTGKLLPGHGGFLDRFDAFIFCLPCVFLFYMIVILLN
jgi:phosphatidate cytidylyltransferase